MLQKAENIIFLLTLLVLVFVTPGSPTSLTDTQIRASRPINHCPPYARNGLYAYQPVLKASFCNETSERAWQMICGESRRPRAGIAIDEVQFGQCSDSETCADGPLQHGKPVALCVPTSVNDNPVNNLSSTQANESSSRTDGPSFRRFKKVFRVESESLPPHLLDWFTSFAVGGSTRNSLLTVDKMVIVPLNNLDQVIGPSISCSNCSKLSYWWDPPLQLNAYRVSIRVPLVGGRPGLSRLQGLYLPPS